MALYAMAFLGTTPIGAPLVGAIAQWTNPRISLLVGAIATIIAAGVLMWRHQAGLRRGGEVTDGVARVVESEAVRDVESNVA